MLTKESFIEWASQWVPDSPDGQRKRFADAIALELGQRELVALSIQDLASARLCNPPLDPNVEHDLREIVKLCRRLRDDATEKDEAERP